MATTAYDEYQRKKEALIKDLSNASGEPIALYKNTSNLFRNRKTPQRKIDVRNFNKVIHVDAENLVAEVEGMTTYEDLVNETLKYNCLPPVVPELKSITIGGALAGCGIEASSFRYGLTPETLLEYEVLLGDGRVVLCRPDNEHKDLFYAFPNTYGTLGYALKIKVKLIPVKKYVKLTHLHFMDSKHYFSELERLCRENRQTGTISYIDSVIFDKNDSIITLGEFVDEAPFVSDYKYMNIYYRSLQQKTEDYLTVKDYIWRWDTDWFWCSKHFFMQNKFMRLLLGKFVLKSTAYWKIRHFFNNNPLALKLLESVKGPEESVIQDVQIPIKNAEAFLDFFQKEIGIKPVWICPTMCYRQDVQYPFYKMVTDSLYINFGFWDALPVYKGNGQDPLFYNKKIEKKVHELEGNKSLYSRVTYTEEEFWKIYDRKLYASLKQRYDPQGILRDLYQKCTR